MHTWDVCSGSSTFSDPPARSKGSCWLRLPNVKETACFLSMNFFFFPGYNIIRWQWQLTSNIHILKVWLQKWNTLHYTNSIISARSVWKQMLLTAINQCTTNISGQLHYLSSPLSSQTEHFAAQYSTDSHGRCVRSLVCGRCYSSLCAPCAVE